MLGAVMRRLMQIWYDGSIKVKSTLLVGVAFLAMCFLVVVVMLQLYRFSWNSSVIMNGYMDITSFLDTFSEENRALEIYIRPVSPEGARDNYLAAIATTDLCLQELQPDLETDLRAEFVLKQAICNAMEYYRKSQAQFLANEDQEGFITEYLSLKTQSAYIDGYARELLYSRMDQGREQWEEISAANTRSSRQFLGFLAVVALLMLFVLTVFIRNVLKPLEDLSRAADQIGSGQYDAPPLKARGNDELGRVTKSFNLMQAEIRRSIHAFEKQVETEKSLREKEREAAKMQRMIQEGRFAQLQSQINPHFLFNTLSTIAALAREEDAPLSEDLILRLSNFFRYSLESDERLVTLGREIQLLRDYMELQETRYGERITMEVVSLPEAESAIVPKFILQPLVENAIIHGLRECTGGGHIRVRVRRGRRGLTITVTDNGCGFDVKKHAAGAAHQSVGIENIRERMELSGGRLDVFSMPGLGTSARITVREEPND